MKIALAQMKMSDCIMENYEKSLALIRGAARAAISAATRSFRASTA